MVRRIQEQTFPIVLVDQEQFSPSLDLAQARSIAYGLVVSNFNTAVGAQVQIEESLDLSNWAIVGSPVAITANGFYTLSVQDPKLRHYRVRYTIVSGSFNAVTTVLAKRIY